MKKTVVVGGGEGGGGGSGGEIRNVKTRILVEEGIRGRLITRLTRYTQGKQVASQRFLVDTVIKTNTKQILGCAVFVVFGVTDGLG